MRNCWIKRVLQKNRIANRIVIHHKNKEMHVSLGKDNPDKIFFVIRRNASNVGLFSYVVTNIGWIKYAVDQGYVPVVDMQNYYNTYITQENIGKTNSWEYYFKQPCGYSMDDISHSKNIILSSLDFSAARNPDPLSVDKFKSWQEYAQQYLAFSDEAESEIDDKEQELFSGKRVLGVLCRGTDYTSTKPKEHPIQPQVSDMILKVTEVMQQQNCEAVYLATEDETIYEDFRNRLGDKLVALQTKRFKDTGTANINELSDKIIDTLSDPAKEKHDKGMDYAVTIGLLSRCNCLVAGQTSGTTGAMLLSRTYDYVYIYDLGLYE